MILVNEAQKIILEKLRPLKPERIPLLNAVGAVLQEDIYAQRDNPPADNSAMDGYAVLFSDISSANQNNPASLRIIEDIPAGQKPSKTIHPGEASRIMTGALTPDGANTVVMQEDTAWQYHNHNSVRKTELDGFQRKTARRVETRDGQNQMSCRPDNQQKFSQKNKISQVSNAEDSVLIVKPQKKGSHIRKQGEDFRKNDLLLSKGTLVTSSNIGIIATAGYAELSVYRKPVVAILSTGDELVDVGAKAEDHQIINSNAYILASQVMECGGKPRMLGISSDRKDEIKEKLQSADEADIIITSGGVSVGDYDFVKDAIKELGSEIVFWKIAMKPGKPLTFSMLNNRPLFGLPGNPVSSFVSFEQFARPAILKMSGRTDIFRKTVLASLVDNIKKKNDGRRHFLRSNLTYKNGGYFVSMLRGQGSNILTSLASANSLLIIPETETDMKAGRQVEVQVLKT